MAMLMLLLLTFVVRHGFGEMCHYNFSKLTRISGSDGDGSGGGGGTNNNVDIKSTIPNFVTKSERPNQVMKWLRCENGNGNANSFCIHDENHWSQPSPMAFHFNSSTSSSSFVHFRIPLIVHVPVCVPPQHTIQIRQRKSKSTKRERD